MLKDKAFNWSDEENNTTLDNDNSLTELNNSDSNIPLKNKKHKKDKKTNK